MLARRGLTEDAVLPISLVLSTLSDSYVAGLSAFRHSSPAWSGEASDATNAWLATFVNAATVAVEQSELLVRQIEALRGEWTQRLTTHRSRTGVRPTPRADSATARLLALLPEAPVLTATTLANILGVSYPAAIGALDELKQAGILKPKSIGRGATAYIAGEVLNVITFSERALASTQFDTLAAHPIRPVPAGPQGT